MLAQNIYKKKTFMNLQVSENPFPLNIKTSSFKKYT